MARRRPSPGFLFRITYRREWWSQPSHRTFLSEAAARRFVDKIMSDGRPDLAPLVELRIDRAPVGRWQTQPFEVENDGWEVHVRW